MKLIIYMLVKLVIPQYIFHWIYLGEQRFEFFSKLNLPDVEEAKKFSEDVNYEASNLKLNRYNLRNRLAKNFREYSF
ncbi:MAG: hypothetical protein R6U35_07255 [Candidatus Humimicrobiaceae bacterium]